MKWGEGCECHTVSAYLNITRKKRPYGYRYMVTCRQVLDNREYTIDEIKVINYYSFRGQSAVHS